MFNFLLTYHEQERARKSKRHVYIVCTHAHVRGEWHEYIVSPLLRVDLGYILGHFDFANHRYDFGNTILDHLTLAASLTIGFGSTA